MPIYYVDGLDHYNSATASGARFNPYNDPGNRSKFDSSAKNGNWFYKGSTVGCTYQDTGESFAFYRTPCGNQWGSTGLSMPLVPLNNLLTVGFAFRQRDWYTSGVGADGQYQASPISFTNGNAADAGPYNSDAANDTFMYQQTLDLIRTWRVRYNGTIYTITDVVWDSAEFVYWEFQFDSTPTTGGLIVRANGVEVLNQMGNPPNQMPDRVNFRDQSGSQNNWNSTPPAYTSSNAFVDDIYVAHGDNTFHGPLKIEDAAYNAVALNTGYTATNVDEETSVRELSITNYVYTNSSNAELLFQAIIPANCIGVMIDQCSRMKQDLTDQVMVTTEGTGLVSTDVTEQSGAASFDTHQEFVAIQNLTGQTGAYHNFGFRPKDLNTINRTISGDAVIE